MGEARVVSEPYTVHNQTMKPRYFALAAISLDGKIAHGAHHFTDWTSKEDKKFLRGFLDTCDAVIVGRNTYETAKKPLSKRNCIVLTRKVRGVKEKSSNLAFAQPEQKTLSAYIKKKGYKKVCVLGGTQTYTFCLQNGFLDELYLTLEPIVFGQGLSLFSYSGEASFTQFSIRSMRMLRKNGSLLIVLTRSSRATRQKNVV